MRDRYHIVQFPGLIFLLAAVLSQTVSGQVPGKGYSRVEKRACKHAAEMLRVFDDWTHTGQVTLDSIQINRSDNLVALCLSPSATHVPVRKALVDSLERDIRMVLGYRYRKYRIAVFSRDHLLEDYIPNVYRDFPESVDSARLAMPFTGPPLVIRQDQPRFPAGLSGNHLAIWASHGLFFDQQRDRWQWQRARLWETVEDIFTSSFTLSYLVPMLENAGATVLLPRERDTQTREVIVDNDRSTGGSQWVVSGVKVAVDTLPGFMLSDTLFPGQNPFNEGSSLAMVTRPGDAATITYIPDIPESGYYAVYVSWARTGQCLEKVHYTVRYAGGTCSFTLNQCMGSGTWIYLGTFYFRQGIKQEEGSVVVHGGEAGGIVTSDAVRFGGGMGTVARKPAIPGNTEPGSRYKLSGMPRWTEGSRYYLQYSGMPDSIVYSLNNESSDYHDDYMSRGEWVNYLIGSSRPQYTPKYNNGPGIPVDLALAFHTDAGITRGDSIIGTLGIYSTARNNGIFPNGQSKMASRDLSDVIMTQLVADFRKQANQEWTRRALWDREYSEAWRPIVPAMLLELLSHQNLADMQYGLDPRFRFLTARAIYKGIVRYLSLQHGREVVIQPLPPDHMRIEKLDGLTIRISWKPVDDPLESTAMPFGYKVYMRTGEMGFDPGSFTADTFQVITLPEWGKLYSFRVTALNEGGESFAGETLSTCLLASDLQPVLVVNGFDRISRPACFDQGDMAGIAWWEDEGVERGESYSHTGNQYNFNRDSEWLDDESQGWGASHAAGEAMPVTGNTFDFPRIHGMALRDAGYSFVSVSDEVFESVRFDTLQHRAVDLIFGEERGTETLFNPAQRDFRILTPGLMEALSLYTREGGHVLLSGAYVGTDMMENDDSAAVRFAAEVLHYTWRSDHATTAGSLYATDRSANDFPAFLQFNTEANAAIYRVESPDAIEPSGSGAFRIYRYASGGGSAAVAYQGAYKSIVLGFPFETIQTATQRAALMSAVMNFFEKK